MRIKCCGPSDSKMCDVLCHTNILTLSPSGDGWCLFTDVAFRLIDDVYM